MHATSLTPQHTHQSTREELIAPCARQGSAGCALDGGRFALFGGWTVDGMGQTLHILGPDPTCDGEAGVRPPLRWQIPIRPITPSGVNFRFEATYGQGHGSTSHTP